MLASHIYATIPSLCDTTTNYSCNSTIPPTQTVDVIDFFGIL